MLTMLYNPRNSLIFHVYVSALSFLQLIMLSMVLCFIATHPVVAQTDTDRRKEQVAQSYEQSGDYRSAARLYQELYAQYPASEEYFSGVVRSLGGLNQYAALVPIIEERMAKYPSVEVAGLYGEVLWRIGRTKDAEAIWDKGINIAPQEEKTYATLAQACIRARASERAIIVLKEARFRLKNKTIFADELSQLLGSAGLYEEAVTETIGVLQRGRNIAVAQARISAYLTNDKAIKETTKALESIAANDRNNVLLQYVYAWFLREIKQYPKALAVTRILDEISRAQGRELYLYAELARNEGFYEEAIQAYNDVIAKGKNSPNTIAALYGYVRALEGKLQGFASENTMFSMQSIAEDQIKDLIERYSAIYREYPQTPFAADALLRIATLYAERLFQIEQAQSTLRRLLTQYGGMESAAIGYIQLGKLFIAQARLTEAEEVFRQAISALKNFPDQVGEAQFLLAEIALYRGNLDTAQTLYQDLAGKPNTDIANDALERLSLLESVMNEKQRSALKLVMQAELREKQRRTDEAVVLYHDAIVAAPRSLLHERSLFRLARLYAQEQVRSQRSTAWQSAIAMCDTLVMQFSDGVFADEALMLWGQLLMDRAMSVEQEAEQLKAKVTDKASPNDPAVILTLMEEAKQRRAEAVYVITQILIKFPKSPLAGSARKRIRALRGDV